MDFPAGMYLKPVTGDEDLFAFGFGFTLDAKALEGSDDVVTVSENGDLIIEGYAARFEGDDRQGENFTDGAFQRGIKAFLSGPASLCYHHKHDLCLGKVLDLQEEEGKGLKMKARVDGAIASHPVLGTYYQQIKNGTLSALSIGGFFRRALVNGKQRIADMDFTEISVTPVPVHTGPSFAVVAGKALTEELRPAERVAVAVPEGEIRDADFEGIQYMLDELDRILTRIGRRGGDDSADKTGTQAIAA